MPSPFMAPSIKNCAIVIVSDDTTEADLNSFFPFDPYKLPLSYSYVEGVYREWAMVALDDEDSEDDEDLNDEDVDDGCGSQAHLSVGSADSDELGRSFKGMSISPMRHIPTIVG